MSAFSPDLLPPLHADRPQVVARFLPTALRRVPSVAKPWGVLKLAVFGVVTLGLYPCHALHTRVRETMAMHAQQIELAAGWFAARLPAEDAALLTAAAAKVRPGRWSSWIGTGLLVSSFVCAITWLALRSSGRPLPWAALFVPADFLAFAWVVLLVLAYLVTIEWVNRQVVAIQQFVLAFNGVSDDWNAPIALPPLVWGAREFYIIAGIAMTAVGMLWALPMMLAWAALKDFSETAIRSVRISLAERMTKISGVEPVVAPAALCTNPDCRLVSPPEAAYCPRCGRSTRPAA